ncbi:hypothetical protein Hanom_Chr10g00941471 [Helianthus anomalus]
MILGWPANKKKVKNRQCMILQWLTNEQNELTVLVEISQSFCSSFLAHFTFGKE